MPASGPVISIVIPAYNEARRIGPTLERVAGYLRGRGDPFEIVVVDDGSTDATVEVVREAAGRLGGIRLLVNPRNRGKGASVARGLAEAMGEYIFFSDADLSTPIETIEPFIRRLDAGTAMVIGSRAVAGSQVQVYQPWYRTWGGRIFNLLVQALCVPGIQDTQCGFKGFRREAVEPILLRRRLDGFAFDVEMVFVARHLGFDVVEVPVAWRNDADTKVRLLHDTPKMFADLLTIRLRALRGGYGGPVSVSRVSGRLPRVAEPV